MITAIEIENFKGIGERQRIELKPITLLFGPNSSGKSTILHALHYAREVLSRHNLDAGDTESGGNYVDLGGFKNLVHNRNWAHNSVRLRFDLDLSRVDWDELFSLDEFIIKLPAAPQSVVGKDRRRKTIDVDAHDLVSDVFSGWIEFEVGFSHGELVVTKYGVGLEDELLARLAYTPAGAVLEFIDVEHPVFAWPEDNKFLKSDSYGILDHLNLMLRTWPSAGYYLGTYRRGHEQSLEEFKSREYEKEMFYEKATNHVIRPPSDFDLDSFRTYSGFQNDTPRDVLIGRLLDTGRLSPCMLKVEAEAFTETGISKFKDWLTGSGKEESNHLLRLPLKKQLDALPSFHNELAPDLSEHDRIIEQVKPLDDAYDPGKARYAFKLLSRYIIGPGRLLIRSLNELLYVGPIRRTVPRNYQPKRFQHVSHWSDGLGAWDAMMREEQLVISVSGWLGDEDRMNTGYELKAKHVVEANADDPLISAMSDGSYVDLLDDMEPGELEQRLFHFESHTRVILVDKRTRLEMLPQDLGEGISQVIPVIAAVLSGPGPLLVAIEQPELHLHPKAQAELGDLLIEGGIKRKNQLLIETHSEHLVLRIQKRIRQSEIKCTDVAIFYVNNLGLRTEVKHLRLDEEGDFIDDWPDGFFPERLKELL